MKKEKSIWEEITDWWIESGICYEEIKGGEINMSVPKYVQQYFPGKVTKERVKKRVKALDNSRFGYKTTEYKDLKKYLRKY